MLCSAFQLCSVMEATASHCLTKLVEILSFNFLPEKSDLSHSHSGISDSLPVYPSFCEISHTWFLLLSIGCFLGLDFPAPSSTQAKCMVYYRKPSFWHLCLRQTIQPKEWLPILSTHLFSRWTKRLFKSCLLLNIYFYLYVHC